MYDSEYIHRFERWLGCCAADTYLYQSTVAGNSSGLLTSTGDRALLNEHDEHEGHLVSHPLPNLLDKWGMNEQSLTAGMPETAPMHRQTVSVGGVCSMLCTVRRL